MESQYYLLQEIKVDTEHLENVWVMVHRQDGLDILSHTHTHTHTHPVCLDMVSHGQRQRCTCTHSVLHTCTYLYLLCKIALQYKCYYDMNIIIPILGKSKWKHREIGMISDVLFSPNQTLSKPSVTSLFVTRADQ